MAGSQLLRQPAWPAAGSTTAATSTAAASASARRMRAATVYRLIARATGYSMPLIGHSARTAVTRRVQANTGPGQTRRSGSAPAVRAPTTRAAASRRCGGFAVWAKEKRAKDATNAKSAQPTSKTQERSRRVPGSSAGVQKDIPASSSFTPHPPSSRVTAPQLPGGQADQDHRIPAQHGESGPRAQRVRDQRLAPQAPARTGRQVGGDPRDGLREARTDDRRDEKNGAECTQV